MTHRNRVGWLEAVLIRAQRERWCTKPYCTTCGALQFRWAYWTAAAREAGIDIKFDSAPRPRDLFAGVSAADREVLVRTLVSGLRALPPRWCGSQAFETLISDLDPPLLRHGVAIALGAELSGTPAGEVWEEMRADAREARARRKQQEAYESPEAVAERRRLKSEAKAIAHARRQSESRRRNAERLELLAALARLSPTERLSRFATDPALNLDSVSHELIPMQEGELVGLEETTATALIARIGRRKGEWGRLRRLLEHRLEADSK